MKESKGSFTMGRHGYKESEEPYGASLGAGGSGCEGRWLEVRRWYMYWKRKHIVRDSAYGFTPELGTRRFISNVNATRSNIRSRRRIGELAVGKKCPIREENEKKVAVHGRYKSTRTLGLRVTKKGQNEESERSARHNIKVRVDINGAVWLKA